MKQNINISKFAIKKYSYTERETKWLTDKEFLHAIFLLFIILINVNVQSRCFNSEGIDRSHACLLSPCSFTTHLLYVFIICSVSCCYKIIRSQFGTTKNNFLTSLIKHVRLHLPNLIEIEIDSCGSHYGLKLNTLKITTTLCGQF